MDSQRDQELKSDIRNMGVVYAIVIAVVVGAFLYFWSGAVPEVQNTSPSPSEELGPE